MKTRWEFFFECTNIRFERVHKFLATITAEQAEAFGLSAQAFDARVIIEPTKENPRPGIEQTGRLNIVLPGSNEQTRDMAFWLCKQVEQQITFSQGSMKVIFGAIIGEHLPDTPEEAKQLGDKPFFAEANMVEVAPTATFNSSSFKKVTGHPLVEQFNAAKSAKNPVNQFLGFFKVLEDLYGPTSKKATLAAALKSSFELLQITQKHLHITEKGSNKKLTEDDFFELVDKLVKTRHQCAHLRSSKGFGITHGHPRVAAEVEPLIHSIRGLAFEGIQMRLSL